MAEISRVLKPGGVFVATTFLAGVPIIDFGNKDIRRVGQFCSNLLTFEALSTKLFGTLATV